MNVYFTASAERDLEHIGDHIARDNPKRARSFVQDLQKKCQTIVDMPYGWPLVPRYENHGIRYRVFGNYLIFYRIDRDQVTIIRIVHSARDYGAILFETE